MFKQNKTTKSKIQFIKFHYLTNRYILFDQWPNNENNNLITFKLIIQSLLNRLLILIFFYKLIEKTDEYYYIINNNLLFFKLKKKKQTNSVIDLVHILVTIIVNKSILFKDYQKLKLSL